VDRGGPKPEKSETAIAWTGDGAAPCDKLVQNHPILTWNRPKVRLQYRRVYVSTAGPAMGQKGGQKAKGPRLESITSLIALHSMPSVSPLTSVASPFFPRCWPDATLGLPFRVGSLCPSGDSEHFFGKKLESRSAFSSALLSALCTRPPLGTPGPLSQRVFVASSSRDVSFRDGSWPGGVPQGGSRGCTGDVAGVPRPQELAPPCFRAPRPTGSV
jgi:hypothetical protein